MIRFGGYGSNDAGTFRAARGSFGPGSSNDNCDNPGNGGYI